MGNLVSSENDMKILKVEQGQAFIQEGDQVTVFSIESEHKEAAEEKPKESSSGVELISSSPINPDNVKIEDIKKYEALMKGKAVAAISNAQTLRGLTGKHFHRRHIWKANGQGDFGPMELQFETASNLISLNIDLSFSCSDPVEL